MTFPERRADPKVVINKRKKHFQNCGFPHSAALVIGRQGFQVYGRRFTAASFAWGRFSLRCQRRPPQFLPRSLTDLATIGHDKMTGS